MFVVLIDWLICHKFFCLFYQKAACEQSKRAYAMRIRRPMLLHDFLASRPRGVFGDVEGVSQQFSAMSKVVVEKFGSLRYIRNETTVVVGPEGGFSAGELEMLMSQLTPMSFSDGILRVETAAIAGLAIVKSMINN
jgi:RsmE family RNA methyltransferase